MPVPKGYVLDQSSATAPQQGATPKLPAGYKLDAPTAQAPAAAPPAPPAAAPAQQGLLSSFADASGLSTLGNALMHPLTTAKNVAQAAGDYALLPGGDPNWRGPLGIRAGGNPDNPIEKTLNGLVSNTVDNVKQGVADYKKTGLSDQTRADFARAVPIAGPAMEKAIGQVNAGNGWGAAGTLGGTVAGFVAPEAIAKGVQAIPGAAKAALAGDVTKPIAGSNVTPLARYSAAKSLGVQFDAADATNSGLLKGVKRVNGHSLTAAPAYENARAANTGALQSATDQMLTGLYDGDRESGGASIQAALKRNQTGLQADATTGFQSLPQDIPLPGLEEVGKTAQKMATENAAYQDLFPSLTPSRAMNVVGDVGGLGPQAPAPVKLSPFVDETGQPIPSSVQAPPRQPQSFAVGQQLRSDLLEFRRKNPDIVAGQGDAMVGQLAGGVDEALTGGSAQLTPQQLSTFRDANQKWADMKTTYDDTSSPLYHAVRSGAPSKLYTGDGLGPKTPEVVRDLKQRLGPDATGALQRGTVESALKPDNAGGQNFKTFGTQLNRIPADYRAELFSPEQNAKLRDLNLTSNVLHADYNPSGSAKLGQQAVEGGALAGSVGAAALGHPYPLAGDLAYHGAQYATSRLMHSPAVVDWLMSPNAPAGAVSPAMRAPLPLAAASRKRKS